MLSCIVCDETRDVLLQNINDVCISICSLHVVRQAAAT